MNLERLLIKPGESPIPSAAAQNAILDALLRNRLLGVIEETGPTPTFPHPWTVTTQRFEAPPSGTATLNPDNTWAIFVAAGTVNDTVPSIVYARQGDPRGWVPGNYVAPKVGDPNYDPRWIDRDATDDPDDPPFLAVRDPVLGQTTATDWTYITDDARISIEQGAFCGAADWELELWRSHVIVTGAPLMATFFDASLPPPRLAKYRLSATALLPTATYGAGAGGWQEIATLYLLRDPNDASSAEIRVRPRQFWPLWAVISQPGGALVSLVDAAGGGIFGGLVSGQLQDVLQGAQTVQWWTV